MVSNSSLSSEACGGVFSLARTHKPHHRLPPCARPVSSALIRSTPVPGLVTCRPDDILCGVSVAHPLLWPRRSPRCAVPPRADHFAFSTTFKPGDNGGCEPRCGGQRANKHSNQHQPAPRSGPPKWEMPYNSIRQATEMLLREAQRAEDQLRVNPRFADGALARPARPMIRRSRPLPTTAAHWATAARHAGRRRARLPKPCKAASEPSRRETSAAHAPSRGDYFASSFFTFAAANILA